MNSLKVTLLKLAPDDRKRYVLTGEAMNAVKVVWKVFCIFVSFVGALTCAFFAYLSHKSVNELKTWQPLNATIISTSIERRAGRVTRHCPIVKVGYDFLGQQQTSTLDVIDGACVESK